MVRLDDLKERADELVWGKREEVVEPVWPTLIFGDGTQAQLLRIRKIRGDDGIWRKEFRFRVTEDLMYKYDITESELVGEFYEIDRIYDPDLHIVLDDDPATETHMLLCDFKCGTDTPILKLVGKHLETIKTLRKRLENSRIDNAVLLQDINKLTSRLGETDMKTVERFQAITGYKKKEPEEEEVESKYRAGLYE